MASGSVVPATFDDNEHRVGVLRHDDMLAT